jgi:hypothetical protein
MRWDELFDDLEAQLGAAEAAELASEVADRTRRLAAEVSLADRLRAARGRPVRLDVPGGPAVSGVLREVGADWLLVDDEAGREVLVVSSAVLAATGLPREHAPEVSVVRRRLGLGSALRGVARDRSAVTLRLPDGTVLTGTIDRVGRDFLELAEHPVGEARRAGQVSGVRAVAFGAVVTVTRMG